MKLIEMILLSDTIKALNNGYFTVSYRLFLNTVFVISSLSMKGCRKSESTDAIIRDGFNRSHAVNCGTSSLSFFKIWKQIYSFSAIAAGQGIYFATDAAISYGYTRADAQGLRHMFLGKHTKLKCFLCIFSNNSFPC